MSQTLSQTSDERTLNKELIKQQRKYFNDVKLVNISISSLDVFANKSSTFLKMLDDIGFGEISFQVALLDLHHNVLDSDKNVWTYLENHHYPGVSHYPFIWKSSHITKP